MKNFEVTFSPVALDDVEETKAYYEKILLIASGKILSLHLSGMMTSAVPE